MLPTQHHWDAAMGSKNSSDAADIAAADRARASSDVRYPVAVMDAMIAGDTPITACLVVARAPSVRA
jgi:hypothetical protein